MANVKSRVKAPKSASTRRGRNSKKSLTGAQETTSTPNVNTIDDNVVMKRTSDIKSLTSEEKVHYLLQNGHRLRDKFAPKPGTKKKINHAIVIKSQGKLMSKIGRIKKNCSEKFKLIGNILKTELMIEDKTKEGQLKTPKLNNNDILVSDQNKSKFSLPHDLDSTPSNEEPETVVKNTRKTTQKPTKKPKANKTDEKKSTKTKQVTLSNGLVLTLSLFQCDYCDKTFSNKSCLRKHIYRHLGLKSHSCPHCPKKYLQRMNLQTHLKKAHLNDDTLKKFLCEICDKPFLLQENLNLHLISHVKNENSFKCMYCEKKFSHHLLLSRHEKQHLVTGRYQCTICNMSYDCRTRLSLHIKSHLKIKDYICQYCGKEFLRQNSLRRHVEISHGGHRIQCPICNKKLKGHLTEHLRTHEKRRPHVCSVCGQRFTQSTQLNVHHRSHTGDRPYPCRICNRPFTHSNALMLHIRRHTGEKPFICAMCPISFSQLPHMKSHMRKIHGKENPYRCTKCDQFFKLKVHLESHIKTCTVGDKELTFEEKIQASVQYEEIEVESVMTLSRMRFLLALLLTMIASKEKLKYLGFNKRLIDDLLVESIEAMGQKPCTDASLTPFKRLKANIKILLDSTVPKQQMQKFIKESKTTEEILEMLTDEKKNE